MNELLLLFREAHPLSDVSRVDRYGRGVTRGVLVSGIERRHERSREGKARPAQSFVRLREIPRDDLFLLVEMEQPLRSKRREEENEYEAQRVKVIPIDE